MGGSLTTEQIRQSVLAPAVSAASAASSGSEASTGGCVRPQPPPLEEPLVRTGQPFSSVRVTKPPEGTSQIFRQNPEGLRVPPTHTQEQLPY
jgi:predicted membrane-bound mannosyltransferase